MRPGAIGKEQVEAAAALWRDYFWPHAKAVFDGAELSDHAKRVRRIARWLLEKRPATVSREDIRRRALSMSATADEAEHALQRLALSWLRQGRPVPREERSADVALVGQPGPLRNVEIRLRNLRNCPNSFSSGTAGFQPAS